jgi:hypothetical protein
VLTYHPVRSAPAFESRAMLVFRGLQAFYQSLPSVSRQGLLSREFCNTLLKPEPRQENHERKEN